MRARHSCRSFQLRNLTEEHLSELTETAQVYSQQNQQLGQQQIRFEYVAAPLSETFRPVS